MRPSRILFAFASATLFACATGSTLDDGFGGAGAGGTPGVTHGSTSSKSTAANTSANSTAANTSANSTAANTSANSTAANTSANSTVASTSVASSAMSSTGSGPVSCNPESPAAGCGAAQHCIPTDTNMPTCAPAGTGIQWALCLDDTDCGPPYECIQDLGTGGTCCTRWCNADSDCNVGAGESCVFGFNPPLLANGVSYGVCYDALGC